MGKGHATILLEPVFFTILLPNVFKGIMDVTDVTSIIPFFSVILWSLFLQVP